MEYNLCSISFRHALVSLDDLVVFAKESGFSGIELWGVHAKSILENNLSILEDQAIKVSMISDYIHLHTFQSAPSAFEQKYTELIQLAKKFQTNKVRIFAGSKGSHEVSKDEQQSIVDSLKFLSKQFKSHDLYLVIETHPNTYADNLYSTLNLIEKVNHEGLRINLDFLHIWEGGHSPLKAYELLKPWVSNYHLKNIESKEQLSIFEPLNVYSPFGSRKGITSLADGVINYQEILSYLIDEQVTAPASIEWFGPQPFQQLSSEISWLRHIEQALSTTEVY